MSKTEAEIREWIRTRHIHNRYAPSQVSIDHGVLDDMDKENIRRDGYNEALDDLAVFLEEL